MAEQLSDIATVRTTSVLCAGLNCTEIDESELRELWLAWRQSQIMLMRSAETMMLRRGWISRRAVISAASKR